MVHCTGCPIVKFCPAKTLVGDYGLEPVAKEDEAEEAEQSATREADKTP